MALLDIEGFSLSSNGPDFVTYGLFSAVSQTPTLTTTTAGTTYGDPALVVQFIGALNRAIPKTAALFVGSRVIVGTEYSQTSTYESFVNFYDSVGAAIQFRVMLDQNTGSIQVQDGNNNVLGTSAAGLLSSTVWAYLEVGCVMGTGTSGSIIVKVNGNAVLTLPAVASQHTANAWVDGVQWGNTNYGQMSLMHQYYCDNTGTENNTFLGDVRVVGRRPSGAGSSTQFTPNGQSTNSANAAVNPPVPATDYNSDATVGATDLFALPALPSNITQVLGMQVKTLASRDSSGTRTMANKLQSGSTTVSGASVLVASTFGVLKDTYQNDPATNAAWTVAAANAAQSGYTIVA